MIQIKARAKINLALDVIRKRQDGYHDIKMIMQQVDLYDEIEIRKIPKKIIYIHSSKKYTHSYKNDLAYRAADFLMQKYDLHQGVEIKINKHIPVAAGLAGGSTDAAAVFMGMNQLFGLKIEKKELMNMSVNLGTDIPFCILGGCAIAEGVGDQLTPIQGLDAFAVLCKPPIRIATKNVYGKIRLDTLKEHPDIDAIAVLIRNQDFPRIAEKTRNLLESVTLEENQEVRTIKNKLLEAGANIALMSGSGPTVFGLFKEYTTAYNAYEKMKKLYDETYLVKTFNGD